MQCRFSLSADSSQLYLWLNPVFLVLGVIGALRVRRATPADCAATHPELPEPLQPQLQQQKQLQEQEKQDDHLEQEQNYHPEIVLKSF